MQNLKMSIARHGSQCVRSTAADRPWKSYFPAREITPDYLPKRDGFYADPILPILNFVGTGDKVRLSPTSAASFAYAVSTGECVTPAEEPGEAVSARSAKSAGGFLAIGNRTHGPSQAAIRKGPRGPATAPPIAPPATPADRPQPGLI